MTLRPPSTARVCPVIKEAEEEAKKTIVDATSSGAATLPMA